MYCKKLNFKDKKRAPLFGIVTKTDSNYLYFKTRKGEYNFSHDVIDTIEPTDIVFDGQEDENE